MVLETLELSGVTILVEQTDRRGSQDVVVGLFILHHELILLAFLVELELFLWIDIGVLERKILVLESVRDRNCSVKIDWCLQDAIAYNTLLLLLEQMVIGGEPVVLSKFTRSLIESIFMAFRIIVVESMTMLVSAARHTTHDWQLDAVDHSAGRTARCPVE